MIQITDSVPPVTTFASLGPADAFVWGGGNIAHAKLSAPTSTGENAIRIADSVLVTINATDAVTPAPLASISMFPPA